MPHIHTPRANAKINKRMNNSSDSSGASNQYSGKAAKVPNVPGALRARPLPKPNASRYAGWLNRNRQPGFTMVSSEMVITGSLYVEWIPCRIVHETAAPRNNSPDTGQWQFELCGNAQQFSMARAGCGKA